MAMSQADPPIFNKNGNEGASLDIEEPSPIKRQS